MKRTNDRIAPSVSITTPTNGATVAGIVTISIEASDNVGIRQLEIRIAGALVATFTRAPFAYVWDTTTAADGLTSINVRAADLANNGTAKTISVTVDNGSEATTTMGTYRYVKADFGAAGNGTTDDTTAINNAIAAINERRGEILVFEPGVYLVPAGITESKQGLVVMGIGATSQGPGAQGRNVGVVIKATTAGAWVWRAQANGDSLNSDDYYGGRFENITFMGDADTAGGLKLEKSYVVVQYCQSHNNTTGIGFLVTLGSSGTSTQICQLIGCGSSDDLIGFQIDAGCNTLINNCYNLKYSVGGIGDTGKGLVIKDSTVSVLGGKFENNDIGVSLESSGSSLIGTVFEGNASYDIDLARPSGTSVSGNTVVCSTVSSIRVGAYQVSDVLVLGSLSPHTITDNGGLDSCVLMGGSLGRIKARHIGAEDPRGAVTGMKGEFAVSNSTLFVCQGGTTWSYVSLAS